MSKIVRGYINEERSQVCCLSTRLRGLLFPKHLDFSREYCIFAEVNVKSNTMGNIDVGVKVGPTGVSGHMKGNVKDCVGFGALTIAGLAAAYGVYMGINYVYQKACKEAGLNTKDNPHNNELGPRYANKSKSGSTKPVLESKPQPTNESDGEAEAEEGKKPEWELLLRGRSDEEGEASVSMEDVENAVDPEVLQELIYQGINLIVANEKVGKTIFCMHLATALAKGERTEILPQCGIVVKQKVFYYEFENNLPIIKKHFFKRIEDVVNKGDLVLIPQAYDGEEMLEEIAKQVVKCRRTYKHLTFVIDCIYDMEVDETNELQQGLKRIYRNAMDDYGCYVTILLVQHLNDGDKVKGSKNLKRSASSIISLTPDDSNDNIVNISWKGRCVMKGGTKCIRKGPREGYEQDLHYEPYEESPIPTPQPDPALPLNEPSEEVCVTERRDYSREKIELTTEQVEQCVEIYQKARNQGLPKVEARKKAAKEILGDESKYATVERRMLLWAKENGFSID